MAKPCDTCRVSEVCKGKILTNNECPILRAAPPEPCPLCLGFGVLLKQGHRQACLCLIRKRVKAYLAPLGPAVEPSPQVVSVFDENDHKRNLYISSVEHNTLIAKGIFAVLLLRGGFTRTYRFLNMYELIEIYLGKRDENSIFTLKDDVLMLTYGFNEFANKRQEDIVLQLLDFRQGLKKITWIYCCGGGLDKLGLTSVHKYIVDHKFSRVCIVARNVILSHRPGIGMTISTPQSMEEEL